MNPRRAFLMCSILAGWASVSAQRTSAATEESLRDAIRQYVEAWNRHDVDAWSGILTDDIWYTEAIDFYERMKGRPAVIGFFGDMVKTTDIKWEIVRVKMMPNGTAPVVLRHVSLIPPKKLSVNS